MTVQGSAKQKAKFLPDGTLNSVELSIKNLRPGRSNLVWEEVNKLLVIFT